MTTLSLDLAAFDALARRALPAVADELGSRFQGQLTEEVAPYPRVTIRRYGRGKTGKIAGSPRDKVDSRALVGSYTVTLRPEAHAADHVWSADHAAGVYLGTRTIPGWPWCEEALKTDPTPAVAAIFATEVAR